jgi:hypothetical protein
VNGWRPYLPPSPPRLVLLRSTELYAVSKRLEQIYVHKYDSQHYREGIISKKLEVRMATPSLNGVCPWPQRTRLGFMSNPPDIQI